MSTINESAVLRPHEVDVSKEGVVATPKEGTQKMDVDLPLMEANNGNKNILETQNNHLSLPNLEEIGTKKEEGEE